MRSLYWVCSVLVLVVSAIAGMSTVSAQTRPVCEYASSDTDGDGFGWEDRMSCRVTEESSNTDGTGACIDDDGDGWGWDGVRVCRIAAADCYDTDPVGDGWGWNGSVSCEVTAYAAPFSELEVLRSRIRVLYGDSLAVSSLVCRWEGDFQVMDLLSDGQMLYSIPGSSTYHGAWSSGLFDNDGIMHLHYFKGDTRYRARIVMQGEQVSLKGASGRLDSDDCFWTQ